MIIAIHGPSNLARQRQVAQSEMGINPLAQEVEWVDYVPEKKRTTAMGFCQVAMKLFRLIIFPWSKYDNLWG